VSNELQRKLTITKGGLGTGIWYRYSEISIIERVPVLKTKEKGTEKCYRYREIALIEGTQVIASFRCISNICIETGANISNMFLYLN
jgi:hypothetical protein